MQLSVSDIPRPSQPSPSSSHPISKQKSWDGGWGGAARPRLRCQNQSFHRGKGNDLLNLLCYSEVPEDVDCQRRGGRMDGRTGEEGGGESQTNPCFNAVIDLFIKIHPKPNYSINNPQPDENDSACMRL